MAALHIIKPNHSSESHSTTTVQSMEYNSATLSTWVLPVGMPNHSTMRMITAVRCYYDDYDDCLSEQEESERPLPGHGLHRFKIKICYCTASTGRRSKSHTLLCNSKTSVGRMIRRVEVPGYSAISGYSSSQAAAVSFFISRIYQAEAKGHQLQPCRCCLDI